MTVQELIREMECWVIAFNSPLRLYVCDMDALILLRNMHPGVRSDYAYKCRDFGLIKEDEVNEFLLVKPNQLKPSYATRK